MLPGGLGQVLVVILFVVPGVVFQAVRSRLRGPAPDELDSTGRILRAITVSAMLGVIYIAFFGSLIGDRLSRPETVLEGGIGLSALAVGLLFVVPAILAVLPHLGRLTRSGGWAQVRADFFQYDPTPTAWDRAGVGRGPTFIRVLFPDGRWVGGYAGPESYMSSFPHERGIYLELAYRMNEDGSFGEAIDGTRGMYIRCDDARSIEFINPPLDGPEDATGAVSDIDSVQEGGVS